MHICYKLRSERKQLIARFEIQDSDYEHFEKFSDEIKKLLLSNVSFKLEGDLLLLFKDDMKNLLSTISFKRNSVIKKNVSNSIDNSFSDAIRQIRLNDSMNLYWYTGVYHMVEDAVIHNVSVMFAACSKLAS